MVRHKRQDGEGPVELGASYDEVGPDLGRLHDAWEVETGEPVLMLFLCEGVEWTPEGTWELNLRWQPLTSGVKVSVLRAPVSWRSSEVVDLLVLATAAFTRVEDSPRLRAHFQDKAPSRSPRRFWEGRVLTGLCGLMVGLGVGWVLASQEGQAVRREGTPRPESSVEAWPTQVAGVPALPWRVLRPVNNQKRAPCTVGLELELSGVCWLPIEKRPCPLQTVSHQGQCLLPVAAL
jgi:hypothetical protein